jgi:hypothetical protein
VFNAQTGGARSGGRAASSSSCRAVPRPAHHAGAASPAPRAGSPTCSSFTASYTDLVRAAASCGCSLPQRSGRGALAGASRMARPEGEGCCAALPCAAADGRAPSSWPAGRAAQRLVGPLMLAGSAGDVMGLHRRRRSAAEGGHRGLGGAGRSPAASRPPVEARRRLLVADGTSLQLADGVSLQLLARDELRSRLSAPGRGSAR